MAATKEVSFTITKQQTVTEGDKELVQMVANDMDRAEIAAKLKLSARTVEAKLDRIRERYNCRNVVSLVMLFKRNNLIE